MQPVCEGVFPYQLRNDVGKAESCRHCAATNTRANFSSRDGREDLRE